MNPGYNYEQQRPRLFTDHGRAVLAVVVRVVREHCPYDGQMIQAETVFEAGIPADLLLLLAALEHLAEVGQLREITEPTRVAPNGRTFVTVGMK